VNGIHEVTGSIPVSSTTSKLSGEAENERSRSATSTATKSELGKPRMTEAVGAFSATGFQLVPECFTDAEITALVADLGRGALRRTRAGARRMMSEPSVAAIARDSRLIELASAAVGCAVQPFKATLFDKSPAANWLVSWHQDRALPMRTRREVAGWWPWSVKAGTLHVNAPAEALANVVAVRLHLDDSVTENGPLRVLSGTHRLGILGDDEIHDLAATRTAVVCCLPRGGLLLMSPLLVHSSSKATMGRPRRVLHFEYTTSLTCGAGLEIAIA
jgi:Phytanoyl-CoA dioxygenase (PhyH)